MTASAFVLIGVDLAAALVLSLGIYDAVSLAGASR